MRVSTYSHFRSAKKYSIYAIGYSIYAIFFISADKNIAFMQIGYSIYAIFFISANKNYNIFAIFIFISAKNVKLQIVLM